MEEGKQALVRVNDKVVILMNVYAHVGTHV
jgi:hypothetical protein